MRPAPLLLALMLLLLVGTSKAQWSPDFAIQGIRGDVHAAVVFENDLWVAGSFEQAGKAFVQNIARWDGAAWHWAGQLEGTVRALAVHDGLLFAGGSIVEAGGRAAGGLAVLREGAWEPWFELESPEINRDPAVFVLHSSGDALHIGGRFSRIAGEDHLSLVTWQSDSLRSTALPLGEGSECRAIAGTVDDLYVGGQLSRAGSISVGAIAHWDGKTWDDLDGGLDGEVNALLSTEDGLYVGGLFLRSGDIGIRSIARWTGSEWEELDLGVRGDSPIVFALGEYRGEVLVGGEFTKAGTVSVNRVVRWVNERWGSMSSGIGVGRIRAFVGFRGAIEAVGSFSRAAGHTAYSIASWNGFWNPLGMGHGMDAPVLDLAPLQDGIMAGGAFTRAGRLGGQRVSTWTGSKWTAQDTQFNDWVLAVIEVGDLLAAGGLFSRFGGPASRHVAIREDGPWRSPRGGVAAVVRVLGEYEGELIAGGPFFRAGGRPAQAIARWNGELWNPLAEGLGDEPLAMLPWKGDLLVGGRFTDAGNLPVDHIARWDGRIWSPGPPGLAAPIHDLAIWDGQLLAAAEGTGPLASGHVHVWNGEEWTELGTGFDGLVLSITPFGDRLLAGGTFRSADGRAAAGLAIWDGLSWTGIPGAVSGGAFEVHDLLVDPTDPELLWVGGNFLQVDSLWSNHIARWRGPFPTWVWPGDTNNDGVVGIRDLFSIAHHWMTSGPSRAWSAEWSAEPVAGWDPVAATYADADGSGQVDAKDILILIERWGENRRTDGQGPAGSFSSRNEIAQALAENLPPGAIGEAIWAVLNDLEGRDHALRVSWVEENRIALTWKQEQAGEVKLQIFDIQGRVVRTLRNKMTEAGPVREDWTGLTDRGDPVAAGVYWARLQRAGQGPRSATVVWTR